MSSLAIPPLLADLASQQHGLVTLEQVDGLGVERSVIGRLLVGREATTITVGVIRIGEPITAHEDLLARWMRFAPQLTTAERMDGLVLAVASHHSAAYALHLGVSEDEAHTFTVSPVWVGEVPDIRLNRARLTPDEVSVVDGLPVTNAIRTIVDLIDAGADFSAVATAVGWMVEDASDDERRQLEARLEPYRTTLGLQKGRDMIDSVLAIENGA